MTRGPDDLLYVLDDAGRIMVYGPDSKLVKQWWMPEYKIGRPEGVTVLRDGRIAVADTHYHRVVIFDADGKVTSMIGSRGTGPGQFEFTVKLTQDPSGNLYVCEYGGNDRVQKFDEQGNFLLQIGTVGTEPGEFQRPSGIVWRDGTLLVVDSINNRVQEFSDDGKFLRIVTDVKKSGLQYPYDIARGPDDTLYVVEWGGGRVTKLSLAGEVLGRFGHSGHNASEFWTPWGVAIDSHSKLIVGDTGNRRLVELQLK